MRILKNIWSQLHRFVFWGLLISLFWFWIYINFVGDTSREKKLLFYVDAYELHWRDLSLALEDAGLPDGIEMIQVRSFDYDIFGSAINGDVYVMKESILKATLEESPEKLAPLSVPDGAECWSWEGQIYGLRVFDPATQRGAAEQYIRYAPEGAPEPEAYYLCLDAQGPHSADGAAWQTARAFLTMEENEP